MDKKSDPVGVRFRSSVLNAIKEIATQQDRPFSEIIDELLDEALYRRAYRYPHSKEKNGNGQ